MSRLMAAVIMIMMIMIMIMMVIIIIVWSTIICWIVSSYNGSARKTILSKSITHTLLLDTIRDRAASIKLIALFPTLLVNTHACTHS